VSGGFGRNQEGKGKGGVGKRKHHRSPEGGNVRERYTQKGKEGYVEIRG